MRLPLNVLLRDLALVAAAVALLVASRSLEGGLSPLRVPVALIAGAMLALVGYLVHEWGHLIAALASRSVVHLPDRIAAVFLFRFDTGVNDRRQFVWMSMGGFVASALVVLLYAAVLSSGALADRVALGLTALGVLATLVLEVPTAWRVLRGGALPEGAAFVRGDRSA